jgi:class 3 adenylate cyclase
MAEERLQRRLAAVLSADVVGYSRLMGLDEAGTLSRLNTLRRELIDPSIAAHAGRIVRLMGDGLLVEFASAVDAVTCAIELQRQLHRVRSATAEFLFRHPTSCFVLVARDSSSDIEVSYWTCNF